MNRNGKKVLIVGSGGRCHVLADAFARSPRVSEVFCAPGNAGISRVARCVSIGVTETQRLAEFAEAEGIDLTVVGPEASLCVGTADEFLRRGLRIFGPTKEAAEIESSKIFAKHIMEDSNVPTAPYRVFDEYSEALEYVKNRPLPAVIKYNGLAAGKGVVVAWSYEEAESALHEMLVDRKFGMDKVIIEDYLEGKEFSFMCLVNGDDVRPLVSARDYKRAYEGDKGPNTGGMGAYSPVEYVSEETEKFVLEKVMRPVASRLVEKGRPFVGLLYGGMMLTESGPKVIEFNARFGDPETEVILPRLKSDIYDMVEAVIEGKDFTPDWSEETCVGIVLASEGYPGTFAKGKELGKVRNSEADVFHMGTRITNEGFVADGGRVMIAVALGKNRDEARKKALRAIETLDSEGFFYRKDIGI